MWLEVLADGKLEAWNKLKVVWLFFFFFLQPLPVISNRRETPGGQAALLQITAGFGEFFWAGDAVSKYFCQSWRQKERPLGC